MKIQSLTELIRYKPIVREKGEESPSQNGQSNEERRKQEQPEPESENIQVTAEKIDQAVHDFRTDSQAQANGIFASVEGQGPGLRVVLKDGGGGVVRQFTGEEFLRIRQGTVKDKKNCGKILDQKL